MRGGRQQLGSGVSAMIMAACVVAGGCKVVPTLTGSAQKAEAQAQRIQELQTQTMRFADEYVGRIVDATYAIKRETLEPRQRLSAHNWMISQTTSAYTSASGPNAVANALDMVVLATLSRRVMQDKWVEERFGSKADLLRRAHVSLEPRAWALIESVSTAEQRATLRKSIEDWHDRNPDVVGVAFIHFHDFAKLMQQRGESKVPGSLFGFLGLDPLSNLDPAVRELEQTRHLAERAIYYLQRMPTMLDMQVERLSLDIALLPDTQRLLAGVDRASIAAESAGRLMSQLPEVIAREREATIDQIMQALYAQEARVRELTVQVRATLEAGTATSDSLNATIKSLDALMVRFQPKPPASPEFTGAAAATTAAPAKPFDIAEYTDALRELAATARELQTLVQAIDSGVPGIQGIAQSATADVAALIDKLFWNLLLLSLIVIAAAFAAALGYRVIRRRLDARP